MSDSDRWKISLAVHQRPTTPQVVIQNGRVEVHSTLWCVTLSLKFWYPGRRKWFWFVQSKIWPRSKGRRGCLLRSVNRLFLLLNIIGENGQNQSTPLLRCLCLRKEYGLLEGRYGGCTFNFQFPLTNSLQTPCTQAGHSWCISTCQIITPLLLLKRILLRQFSIQISPSKGGFVIASLTVICDMIRIRWPTYRELDDWHDHSSSSQFHLVTVPRSRHGWSCVMLVSLSTNLTGTCSFHRSITRRTQRSKLLSMNKWWSMHGKPGRNGQLQLCGEISFYIALVRKFVV